MSRYRKVVWHEGMFLTPHHFQQADNYYEELLNLRLAAAMPYEWGVIDLQINRESIANGIFELVMCRAVMPDGLTVIVPDIDLPPDPRPIETHFAAGVEQLDVHLAVPTRRIGAANFQANGDKHDLMARYWTDEARTIDEVTGENDQPVMFARNNLRLIFADELRDGYSAIKIAELVRTATGQIKVYERYVPPALTISASPWLVNTLRQIVEILITKSSTLGEK